MTESEYIEASNLARLRAAMSILRDCIPGYGPVTQENFTAIYRPLSELVDECFDVIITSDEQ
jgi:hypothetical protein